VTGDGPVVLRQTATFDPIGLFGLLYWYALYPIHAVMFEGMLPMDEMLRESGQYGPRVAVPDDADSQTKLLAFIGRTP